MKKIRHTIGIMRRKNANVNVMPSIMQKIRNTANVSPKFIREEMFLEKRKRYLGILIFVKISAFAKSEPIPPLVASEK